jgi:predicted dehydrogenase
VRGRAGGGCHPTEVPIDVALLGCAHPHVPDVLGVIASEPDLRLVAAWDEDPSVIPSVLGGQAVGRAETAIRRAHAVVVCAPADQRPALCAAAAQAGRPVLVEKPVALSAADGTLLIRELERSRTPAMPALFLRRLPALERLRGVLRERLLGRIASIDATYAHAGALDGRLDGPAAWLRDPARAGVGPFGDLALHLLDAIGLLGREEPPRLAAVALEGLGGTGLGSWAGVPLTVRASWATRPGGLQITIAGERGTAVLHGGTLELVGASGEPERWVGAPPEAGEALRGFADALRTRRFPRDGLEPAVRAQATLEAAVRVA